MAVYQCQCDLILSTPDCQAHCPRCRRRLEEGDRLFLGAPTAEPAASNPEQKSDYAEPSGPSAIVARGLYGFAFAIAHIRAVGQAWLSS